MIERGLSDDDIVERLNQREARMRLVSEELRRLVKDNPKDCAVFSQAFEAASELKLLKTIFVLWSVHNRATAFHIKGCPILAPEEDT